jgi:hypothetical protein
MAGPRATSYPSFLWSEYLLYVELSPGKNIWPCIHDVRTPVKFGCTTMLHRGSSRNALPFLGVVSRFADWLFHVSPRFLEPVQQAILAVSNGRLNGLKRTSAQILLRRLAHHPARPCGCYGATPKGELQRRKRSLRKPGRRYRTSVCQPRTGSTPLF